MTAEDLRLLDEIWKHFDGIADGAPDASHAEQSALRFSEPLANLIRRERGHRAGGALKIGSRLGSSRVVQSLDKCPECGEQAPQGVPGPPRIPGQWYCLTHRHLKPQRDG